MSARPDGEAMVANGPSGGLPSNVLGIAASCHVGDVDSAARAVISRGLAGAGGYVCLCNVHLVTLSLHDTALRRALGAAWKRLPDGAPVAWLQRRLGHSDARRIGGPDLMPRVADLGREQDLRHFLLGSTGEVLRGVESALKSRYDGVQIAGSYSPPFAASASRDASAIEVVRAAAPHVVWCALGAPKQELWMHRFAPTLPNVLFLGVGAAFDFLAQTKPRAPRWMQARGLEWLHRLGSEPTRLGARYLRTNTEFIVRSGFELTRRQVAA